MTAFTNARYDASKLLKDYERELRLLNERWPEIQLWHEGHLRIQEAESDAVLEFLDKQSKYKSAKMERWQAEYRNKTKSWWRKAEPFPELPPKPVPPSSHGGLYGPSPEDYLYRDLCALRAQLQAGYQAAYLGSTLDATAEQMADIFAIAEGTKLDKLLQKFDKFNRARPDAGNTQE